MVRGEDLIVRLAADGHAEDDGLRRWVDRGVADAASLPPKGP